MALRSGKPIFHVAAFHSPESLLKKAENEAEAGERYAKMIYHYLKNAEEDLTQLHKKLPKNATRQMANQYYLTMHQLAHHTKLLAKHAKHAADHLHKLKEHAKD